MSFLEQTSTTPYQAHFVDLFVRDKNAEAITFYQLLGYIVFRVVVNYYNGNENAYDMRRSLPRDVEGKSVQTTCPNITPDQLEWK